MYLLDTNIVSMLDPRRREHAPRLIEWLERNGASLFLSVMTIIEMDAGVLKLRRQGKTERAGDSDGFRGSGSGGGHRDRASCRAAWRGGLSRCSLDAQRIPA